MPGQMNPAISALQRMSGRRAIRSPYEAGGDPGISESVLEADPSLSLPFVAGPGENQQGLDFLRSRLGPGPLFRQQEDAVADTTEQQRQAFLGGFESPQAQAGYGREFDRYKADAPVRQQQMAGQYGVKEQQAQGAGNLAVEQTRQQGMKDQSQNMLQLYQMLLGSGSGGQGSNIAGMTMPSRTGGGGIRFQAQQRPGNPLLRDVTAARTALEAARNSNWMGDPMEETNVQQADAQFRAALGQVFAQDPSDSDIKEVAIEIAADPDLADLPVSQLLEHPKFNQSWDANALSDEDLSNLDR